MPAIASIAPSSTIVGGQSVNPLSIGGSNFVSRSVVRWNGTDRVTTFSGENSLSTSIPANDLSAVGTAEVTVFTPGPGGGTSNALTLTINPNPVPVLTTLVPSRANAGGPGFILTARGSGLGPSSVIRWNGSDRRTSFPGQFGFPSLSANILASDIATAGEAQVTVFNPGGGVSNVLTFTITIACSYSLSTGGQVFPAAGGTGMVTISTSPGCPWTAANSLPWVTINGAGNRTGPGTLSFQVAADPGGPSGTFTVAGLPFRVEQQVTSIPGLSFIGSMPHIAAQDVWTTTFTLVNKATSSATARLSLFGDPAGDLNLPLLFPQTPSTPLSASSLDRTIPGNASLVINTAGPQTPPVQIGSAQLSAAGALDGFAIFRLIPGAQEAVVPLETRNAGSYLLAFDNTAGVVLGVAVQNISGMAFTIPVIIRDDTGAVISPPGMTLSLAANGHNSFVLSDQYLFTANKRGTIEFDTPSRGRISVLGIRTTPLNNTFTLTTIPALANISNKGGSIAHIATGAGWQTTFVLVNTGTSSAQATLKFFATGTGAPLSIPLKFPQTGNSSTANSISQTLAAGATRVVQSTAPASNPAPTVGSAQLTTNGNVGGFVMFRYDPNGQEAVVPLESRTANGYLIAFDNTAGTATGIAVNNASSQPMSVPVIVRDDAGNQIATDTLTLAANGHTSFALGIDKYPVAVNKRGTIEFVGGKIGALGIRIPPALTFTTLPALAK